MYAVSRISPHFLIFKTPRISFSQDTSQNSNRNTKKYFLDFRFATARMMSSTADFVKAEIAGNDVVVFSKSYCPFCKKTKNLFLDLNIDAKVYELNDMDNGSEIQDELLSMTGQNTVPNVFVKGEHIGGNDDTQAASKSGKINELLGK